MKFCDLGRQYNLLKSSIDERIEEVLRHGMFINGPEVKELEDKCARFVGASCAVGVSSGTDALLVSLMIFDVRPGDYVITTPFTFIATAEVIALLGARPLFVDIDEKTYNIAPQKIEAALKHSLDSVTNKKIPAEKIRGIISVDLYGQPADYDRIREIMSAYTDDTGCPLFLIEDGAQSFGSQYKGRQACGLGDVSVTSFFPAKAFGGYGDGGMVFTDNKEYADKIRWMRVHGQDKRYNHKIIGLNARLDTLQAAILLGKFDAFINEEIEKRNRVADWYTEELKELTEQGLILPYIEPFNKSVWAQYSVRIEKRDELIKYLKAADIPTAIHYPKPLHLQEAFGYLGYSEGSFPVSEMISARIVSLPMYPYIKKEEVKFICAKSSELIKSGHIPFK